MAIGSSTGSVLGTAVFAPGAPGGAGGPGGGPPPTPGTGWELKAVSAADYSTLLGYVPDRLWTSLTTSDMLNSQAGGTQGSGTVVLNMDDPWWSTATFTDSSGTHPAHYLLDAEHLWQLWQNGVIRFEFLGESVTENLVQQGEGRLVTVTGPDTSQMLNWGAAMPPGFPGNIVYKTDALQDSFSEVDVSGNFVIDTGLWNASSGSGISINPSGSARINGTSGNGTTLGTTTWDLTSSLLSAQVTPIVSPDASNNALNGSQVTQMVVEDTSSGYYVLIGMSSTSLYAQYHGPDGTVTKIIDSAAGYASVQQNAGTYAYWQVSHAGGFFYFWTSSDGQNWVQQYSHAAHWAPSSVGVFFTAVYSASSPAEWATVSSVNSNVTASSLGGATYLGKPIMSVFLSTLRQAQARGTVPWVTTRMTAAADSYGNPWTDTNNVQIQNGTTLYQLLQGQAAMINADWKMFPGFELRVGIPNQGSPSPNNTNVTLGFDRSSFVRFYEAGGEVAKTRQRARNQIVNLLAAINTDGRTVTAQNASSISLWSQREAWVQAAAQVTETDLAVVADAAVLANDGEVLAWTLQITPNQPGRTVYQDFQVGDWVGLERPDFSGVDAVRVVGIAVAIDQDGNEAHELTLVSYMQWLTQNLLYIQNKMGGGFVSASGTTAVSGNAQGSTQQAPTVFNERLGALGTSGASGAPMVYNAATGQWVPAGSTDPVSGQTVVLSVPGQGAGTIIGGGTITVGSTGNNPVPLNTNYNFAKGTTGWGAQRMTLTVVNASSTPAGNAPDANVAKLVPTQNGAATWLTTQTGAPQVPTVSGIVAGTAYTLTAYVYLASQATMTIAVKADWYDARGALLSTTSGTAGPVNASAWQQVSFGMTAPANAVKCNIFTGPVTAATTNPLYVTDFFIYNASDASGSPDAAGAGGSTTTTVTGGGTTITDGTGTVRAVAGAQPDGTITFQGYNGPAPLAPSAPVVTSTMLGINIAWDGTMSDGSFPLLDFRATIVHVSTTNNFTPSTATQCHQFETAMNYTMTQLVGGTTYYVKLVAANDSGISGPASAQASAVAQTVSQNIPSGSISSGQLNFSAGGVNVTFSATVPASANLGDLWYNTASDNLLSVCTTAYASGGVAGDWTAKAFGTNALTAGSIITGLLAAGAVTAGKIAAGTITAINLAVGSTTQQNIYAAGGDTTGWTGHGGTLTGLASSLPAGAPYSSCFRLSTDGSTPGPEIQGTASANGVVAGGSYMASAWVFSANTAAQLGFVWLNSSAAVISSSLTSVTVTASTWTLLTAFGTAPAGAVSCYLVAGLSGTPASSTLFYATEIKLFSPFNGGIIQAGTIATAQLAANSVTANQLAANSVTANAIAANSVTSAAIAAGTITANDLAVGGTYNQNTYFAGADTTGYSAVSGSVSGTSSPPGTPPFANAAVLTCNGGAAPHVSGPQFAVAAGHFYMAQCWVYSASTSATIGFQWFDANKNSISTATQGWTLAASTWTQVSAVKQAPANAAFASFQAGLSGTPGNGTLLYAQEALVFLPFSGGVIEAGTVTATQIAAGTITAAQIAAGTVVAGIVDATTIIGSTFIGNSVQLSGANEGLFCYDALNGSLVGAFTGAAGTDPVNGGSVVAGVQAQRVMVYGNSPPSSVPPGAAIFYATTNGTPAYKNTHGYNGQLAATGGNVQDTGPVTGTAFADVTRGWPVPASDPEVGTVYRLTAWGAGNPGTSSSSVALGFEISFYGGLNVSTGCANMGFIGNNAFYWKVEAVILVLSTGSSGTCHMNLSGQLSLAGRDSATQFASFVGGTGAPVTFNMTAATTLSVQAAWSSVTGSPTITGHGSVLERCGA